MFQGVQESYTKMPNMNLTVVQWAALCKEKDATIDRITKCNKTFSDVAFMRDQQVDELKKRLKMANEGVDGYPCGKHAKDYIMKLQDDLTKMAYLNSEAQAKMLESNAMTMDFMEKYWAVKSVCNDKSVTIENLRNLRNDLEEQVENLQVRVNQETNRADNYLAQLEQRNENNNNNDDDEDNDDGLFDDDDDVEEVHVVGPDELVERYYEDEAEMEKEVDDGMVEI